MALSRRRRNTLNGLLFASPWILGFLLFTLGPIAAALYYSFTEFNIIQTPRWIYTHMIAPETYHRVRSVVGTAVTAAKLIAMVA